MPTAPVGGRRPLALAALAALLVGAAVALILALGGSERRLVPGKGPEGDPLAWQPARDAEFQQRAAAGEAHVLYAKSPGGAVATAARVARWRPLVEQTARRYRIDPDMLEAIVFLESGGRPDAQASSDLAGAAGLTQIVAGTATSLLHMHVDLAASKKVAKQLARARQKGLRGQIAKLQATRRKVDQRFDPAKALDAAGRYIVFARGKLGRDDLAIESYHMGVGNLQNALAAYGSGRVGYTQLYFDSTPLRHPEAYARLATLGDDSATYLWRLLAAREIMRLHRTDPAQLARIAGLQVRKSNAEEVLHPRASTTVFGQPSDIRSALAQGELRPLPANAAELHLRIDPGMGELARPLHQSASLYRALRPEALALLVYLGAGVDAISHQGPLTVTSTVRDARYQKLLEQSDIQATHAFSLHTTGYAFDILRSYRSRSEALAFQFMLDRLQALNLIAWAVEPNAIHITVSSDARQLEPLLRRVK